MIATLERDFSSRSTGFRRSTGYRSRAPRWRKCISRVADGAPVAVKVLRPDIDVIIAHDLALMQRPPHSSSAVGRRPAAAPARGGREFENRSATNWTSRAKPPTARNCGAISAFAVAAGPEIHWDYTSPEVLVMERMAGIHRVDELVRRVDLKRLARAGVEIFFTQVFRDGYFHADMHPGNIFVAIDSGNHGSTSRSTSASWSTPVETDKSYLAQNFSRSSVAITAA